MTKAEETQAVITAARNDFFVYMALVHRETDMPDVYEGSAVPAAHHMRMISALLSDELGHTIIVAPRGSGKTTILQGFIEWKIGKKSLSGDKNWANRYRVLYVSAAASQAYKVSNGIRATIESNEHYHAVFPEVRPHSKKWGEEEWKLHGNKIKDSNFQAVGIDGAALGSRADEIYLDDVGDEKNMATPYVRQQVRDRLDNTILPILVPWGRIFKVCTRWAWDDTADWAIRERGFHTVYMKALTENEEGEEVSFWEERFPATWLQAERAKNPKAFSRQYQNEVTPDEGLTFEREWFSERFDYLPTNIRWIVCSWDTAAGQGRNRSYSAGWSAAITTDFHVYLFRLTRGQVPYPYLREAVKHQALEDRAHWIIIEKKSSGHQLIQEYALDKDLARKIIEWQPFGQKGSPSRMDANERIATVGQQGRIHLPSEFFARKQGASWLTDAEKEIFSYPEGESDDIVDALCQMLYWVEEQRLAYEKRLGAQQILPGRWVTPRGPGWTKAAV